MTDIAAKTPTRQRLLEASRRLFSERGFYRTSVRDIAGLVGVTDAALYRHFRSKRELLEALLEDGGLNEAYRRLATVPDEVPLERALVNMALGTLRFHDENRELLKVILLEGIAADEAVRQEFQELTRRWVDGVEEIIRRRAAREGLAPEQSRPLAAQLVAYLWGIFLERLLGSWTLPLLDEGGALTPEVRQFARVAVSRIIQGARAVGHSGYERAGYELPGYQLSG